MRNAERIRSPFPLALGLALALAARPAAWSAPPEPGAEPEPAADLADYLADESALTEEADTVVTAALYAQRVDRTPANVHVIPRSRIRALEPKSVGDLLRFVPGFSVLRRQQLGEELSAFGVGGQFSNKVLVLLDGHPVIEPGFGNVLWNDLPVSAEELERVEVVLGPESTLYGTSAFGAVVNLSTRQGSDVPAQRLKVRAGNRGYNETSWSFRKTREDATRFGVTATRERRGSFGPLEDAAGVPDPVFHAGEGFGRGYVRLTDERRLDRRTRLDYSLSALQSSFDTLPVAPGTQRELGSEDQALMVAFNLERELERERGLALRGTWTQRARRYAAAPFGIFGVPDQTFDSSLLDMELRSTGRAGPWRLVAGLGVREISTGGYIVSGPEDDAGTFSVFAHAERSFGERFVLFLGVRPTFQDLGSDEVSWKAAGLYRPRRDTGLRLSVGTSFRQPDLISARLRPVQAVNGIPTDRPVLMGDPTLKNEVSSPFVQAGVERRWKGGSAKLDLYAAEFENLIALVGSGPGVNLLTPAPVPLGAPTKTWMNSPFDTEVRGVTLGLEQELGRFRLALGMNFQDVEGPPGPAAAPYAPSRSGSLVLELPARPGGFGGSLAWSGVGPYDVDRNAIEDGAPLQMPGFGMLDLSVVRRFGQNRSLAFSVKNLLDQQHREVAYSLIGDGREQGVRWGREYFLTFRMKL